MDIGHESDEYVKKLSELGKTITTTAFVGVQIV